MGKIIKIGSKEEIGMDVGGMLWKIFFSEPNGYNKQSFIFIVGVGS